jgi:hypothetical protein
MGSIHHSYVKAAVRAMEKCISEEQVEWWITGEKDPHFEEAFAVVQLRGTPSLAPDEPYQEYLSIGTQMLKMRHHLQQRYKKMLKKQSAERLREEAVRLGRPVNARGTGLAPGVGSGLTPPKNPASAALPETGDRIPARVRPVVDVPVTPIPKGDGILRQPFGPSFDEIIEQERARGVEIREEVTYTEHVSGRGETGEDENGEE